MPACVDSAGGISAGPGCCGTIGMDGWPTAGVGAAPANIEKGWAAEDAEKFDVESCAAVAVISLGVTDSRRAAPFSRREALFSRREAASLGID